MQVIPMEPPVAPLKRRPSKWADAFGVARQQWLVWHLIDRPYAKSTAQQVASDIRCADKRGKRRLTGIHDGESWDATWGEIDGAYYVWICFEGKSG